MTNQTARNFVVIVKLISIQPMELEHLLFKVLVIDRTTVHVINSTWQDAGRMASPAEVVGAL